jgi:hypothetical protein
MAVFWVVALCRLVRVYQRFRGLYCLHLQGNERSCVQEISRDKGEQVRQSRSQLNLWGKSVAGKGQGSAKSFPSYQLHSPHSCLHCTSGPPTTSNHPHSHPVFTRLPPSEPYEGEFLYPFSPLPMPRFLTSLL